MVQVASSSTTQDKNQRSVHPKSFRESVDGEAITPSVVEFAAHCGKPLLQKGTVLDVELLLLLDRGFAVGGLE